MLCLDKRCITILEVLRNDSTIKNEKLYTVKEVAEILQMDENQIYVFLSDGKLKGYKFGDTMWRILDSHLTDFIIEARANQKRRNESC